MIVAKLLAKDPDDRYQTAQGLLKDLERLDPLEPLGEGEPPHFPRQRGGRLSRASITLSWKAAKTSFRHFEPHGHALSGRITR